MDAVHPDGDSNWFGVAKGRYAIGTVIVTGPSPDFGELAHKWSSIAACTENCCEPDHNSQDMGVTACL
jgi:hypothetical protein